MKQIAKSAVSVMVVLTMLLTMVTVVFPQQPVEGTVITVNPTFDQNTDGWQAKNKETLTSVAGGRNNSNALLVDLSTTTNNKQASPYQAVKFENGATYTLSVFIRLPEGTDYDNNYAVMCDASSYASKPIFTYEDGLESDGQNYPTIIRNTKVAGTDWVELKETFTVKSRDGADYSEGKIYIQRNSGTPTNYYVDDFYLVKHDDGGGEEPDPEPEIPSLTTNPTFNQNTAGWTAREKATISSVAGGRNNTNALLVDVSTATGTNEKQASPQQTVQFESGATYTLSVFVRLPEGTDYTNSYTVMCDASKATSKPIFTYADGTDTSGATNYPTIVRSKQVAGTDWVELTETFTVESRQGQPFSEGTIYIQRAAGDKTNYYIDDFYITKQPKTKTVTINENPTFDENIDGWLSNGGSATSIESSADGRNGTKGLQVKVGSGSYVSASPKQTVVLEKDVEYTISVWVKLPEKEAGVPYDNYYTLRGSNGDVKVTYTVNGGSAQGPSNYPILIPKTQVKSLEWQELTTKFVITKTSDNSDTVPISFYLNRESDGDNANVNYLVDDFYITKEVAEEGTAPKISNLAINGSAYVDGQLTGSYTYYDSENDPEEGSTYRWLRGEAADSQNWTEVASGTITKSGSVPAYKPVAEDKDKFIKFEVTPRNAGEPSEGEAVSSDAVQVKGSMADTFPKGKVLNANPSFDENLDGWTCRAEGTEMTQAIGEGINGSNAVRITGTPKDNDRGASPQQDVTLKLGQKYFVSLWVKQKEAVNAQYSLRFWDKYVYADDGQATYIQYDTGVTFGPSNYCCIGARTTVNGTNWVNIKSTFVVTQTPEDKEEITGTIFVNRDSGDPFTELLVDEIYVIEVEDEDSLRPTVSDLSVGGKMAVGETVTAEYTFSSKAEGAKDVSEIKWLRANTESGLYTQVGTGKTYQVTDDDIETFLKFEVMPKQDVEPYEGRTSVTSAPVSGPCAPTATDVAIEAPKMATGETITGKYTFTDANGDNEDANGSAYRWLRADAADTPYSEWEAIQGATSKTYVLTEADEGKYLKFEVTPVADKEPTTGFEATSQPVAAPAVPTATDVAIATAPVVGRTVEGQFTYNDVNGGDEGTHKYQWYISDTADGELKKLENQTAKSISVISEYDGRYLVFEVTPVSAEKPYEGQAVKSAPMQVSSSNEPPSATEVAVDGTAQVGGVVVGSYAFSDPDGDEEGDSVYKWYVGDSADGTFTIVENQTGSSMLLDSAYAGKYIKFEVTPADSFGKIGATVASAPVLVKQKVANALYVATNGSDQNDGSEASPLQTLEGARDRIRQIKAESGLPKGGIVVYLKEGTYSREATFTLTGEDSGTAESPIIYRAFGNDKVIITGATNMDASKATAASSAIQNRIIDTSARSKVMQLDLKALGIPESHYNKPYTKDENTLVAYNLYINGEQMTLARYPNGKEYNKIPSIVSPANTNEIIITFSYSNDDRPSQWVNNGDLWMFGLWGREWYGEHLRIDTIDTQAKTITTADKSLYGVAANQRYYYFNILEELDEAGEYYLDRENGMLYFYPPAGFNASSSVQMTYLMDDLVKMDRVQYVSFVNLDLNVAGGSAIASSNGSNITVNNVNIANVNGWGVDLSGGKNNTVKNSVIHNTGVGGVRINGGNRKTLEPSGSLIENCDISETNRMKSSYSPNIQLVGVGTVVRHNRIHGNDHTGFQMSGNDFVIEYNEFFDLVREAQDMGAIYSGRNPTELGNTVRYNYFHDIHSNSTGAHGSQAIFIDDGSCDLYVFGNIFDSAGDNYTFKTNGGQFHVLENNIFIANGTKAFSFFQNWNYGKDESGNSVHNWVLWLNDKYDARKHNIKAKLTEINYDQPPYSTTYPFLLESVNGKDPGKSNKLINNVVIGASLESGSNSTREGVNYTTKTDVGFVDMANKDYTLKPDSIVYTKIPGFEPLDFKSMGLLDEIPNDKPTALSVAIAGSPSVGGNLYGTYQYYDAEGDLQASAEYTWLMANLKDGTYETIAGQTSNELVLNESMAGKWIKFRVVLTDASGSQSVATESEPVQVKVNKNALLQLISEANELVAQSTVGTDLGQCTQTALDALKTVIAEVQGVYDEPQSTGAQIAAAADTLLGAVETFADSLVFEKDFTITEGSVTIPASLRKMDLTFTNELTGAITLDVPKGRLPGGDITVTVNGKQLVFGFEADTAVENNRFELVTPLDTPSAQIYGDIAASFQFGGTGVLDKPARILIPGAAGKTAMLIADGTAQEINNVLDSDSADALGAQSYGLIEIGNDLVIWTKVRGEYAAADLVEPSSDATLASLSVNGKEIKLSATKTSYSYTLPAGTTEIPTVVAKPTNRFAKVEVTITSVTGTFPILVTAQDGTTKEYSLKLTVADDSSNVNPPYNGGGGGGNNQTNGNNGGVINSGSGSGLLGTESSVFTDCKNHWAKDDIEEMYRRGIVSGVTDTTFEPDRQITRAEFAALIVRALGLSGNSDTQWNDVSSDAWYASVVNAISASGMMVGFDGYFRPDDLITREEMAVIIAKAYVLKGGAEKTGGIEKFVDVNDISAWARGYVDTAATAGLINGMTPTTFIPQANTTRAEAASIIRRLLDQF